jgi:hypothetical protein
VAINEELLARGYLLQTLAQGLGRPLAVFVSSSLFALGHLFNPNASPVAVAGLLFAGLLLASAYLVSGRLWLPIGLHQSWNFFLGPIFGFPVSGIGNGGLLRPMAVGPDLLSGGEFGPEASLIGVAAELLGMVVLWLLGRRIHFPYASPAYSAPESRASRSPISDGERSTLDP